MKEFKRVSIVLPSIVYNEMIKVINHKNSIYNSNNEFIKLAIMEKVRKEKKSD